MKKLLTVSLVAMMAVTTARAEIASKAYVDQQDGTLSSLNTTAKNNLVSAINELVTKTGTGTVAEQIASAVDQSYTPASAKAQSGTAVAEAIATVSDTAGSAIQSVKVNGTALEKDANNAVNVTVPTGALASKDEVAESDLESALATKINGKANTADLGALATKSEVAESDLATALATKINGKADEATSLAGYGITDAYTKTEADGKYQTLANKTTDLSGTFADDTEYPSAKAVKAAITAAAYDDSGLDARLDVLEGSGAGSVAKAEQDAKDYADSLATNYAAASHNHASQDVNAMTGYTKAQTAAAIDASTDTLNTAIGKLEYKVDAANSAATTAASDSAAGVAKLYATTGQNTDGSMTQKAVTDALALKADDSDLTTLAGRVSANETAIGDANSGLTKGVADNAAAIAALDSTYATDQALTTGLAGKQDTLGSTNVSDSGTGNVVTGVSASNGVVTVSKGNAILSTDTINENGTWALTATRTGESAPYTYTYQWELIRRAGQQ